jgi:ATP-dependent 26S proteasome regulatory subunit
MTNNEKYPSKQIDHISGRHADICLVEPEKWHTFLAETTEHKRIFQGGQDDLPLPFTTASIDFWSPSEEADTPETFGLSAQIAFGTENLHHVDSVPWQTYKIAELKDHLSEHGISGYTLGHEVGSLYAHITPDHIAHITLTTKPNECSLNATLESFTAIKGLIDIDVDDMQEDISVLPYDTLKGFLNAWSKAIDVVATIYDRPLNGKHQRHHTLSLSVVDVITPTKELTTLQDSQEEDMPSRELLNESRVLFHDIAGYDTIKDQLLDLNLLHKHPELAQNIGLATTHGILLHGAPGTAKTMLLRAFANEIDADIQPITVSEIIDKYVGESAKKIDTYFQDLTKRKGKIVVLMDEFDSIGASSEHSSSSERTDAVNRLKEWILTIGEKHHNIILTAATNDIDKVDKALIRPGRFLPIEVPLPTETMRRDIWALMLGKVVTKAMLLKETYADAVVLDMTGDTDALELARRTEGMVGAHFTEILNAIRKQRLREYDQTGVMHPITQDAILRQINQTYLTD